MKKYALYIFTWLLLSVFNVGLQGQVSNCYAFNRTNNWYFSTTSMNFSSQQPSYGASPIVTYDDTFQATTTTMSDTLGNLLFYSDGATVWDRNHNIMPNGTGLLGLKSSTQSCLAVPFPGHPQHYYLFTTDGFGNNFANASRFSVIDMSLNNGMGDVVDTLKNILFRANTSEKLTATYHANGEDIWIAVSDKANFIYHCYLLTSAGLTHTPVTSTFAGNIGIERGIGGMKFSHDGRKVAISQATLASSFAVADFNTLTGEITNAYSIPIDGYKRIAHSFEFSPDNSKLYVVQWGGTSPWNFLQFDVAAGSPSAVQASQYIADTRTDQYYFGTLCLGNDDKIYLPAYQLNINDGGLDYIASPNLAGALCGYTQGVQRQLYDLPNLLRAPHVPYTPVVITAGQTALCSGQSLTLSASAGFAGYEWQDGSTDSIFTVQQPGTYWVTVATGCGFDTDSITIAQSTISLNLTHGNDTVACKWQLPFTLTAPAGYAQYQWQNGNTNQNITVSVVGEYWVQVTDSAGCTGVDTFRVEDCTGIDEQALNGIKIYPNPADEMVYIDGFNQTPITLKLYNAAGQLLSGQTFTGKAMLPLGQLSNGVYIVELISEKGVVRRKLLKVD